MVSRSQGILLVAGTAGALALVFWRWREGNRPGGKGGQSCSSLQAAASRAGAFVRRKLFWCRPRSIQVVLREAEASILYNMSSPIYDSLLKCGEVNHVNLQTHPALPPVHMSSPIYCALLKCGEVRAVAPLGEAVAHEPRGLRAASLVNSVNPCDFCESCTRCLRRSARCSRVARRAVRPWMGGLGCGFGLSQPADLLRTERCEHPARRPACSCEPWELQPPRQPSRLASQPSLPT